MLRLRYVSKGLLAALILSILIAFTISFIPKLQAFEYNYELAAFKQQSGLYLSENNIVDFVASFSSEMQIKRVILETNSLSIDFLIEGNKKLDTNTIYEELYNVIKRSLVQTQNVNEALIRVFLYNDEKIFVAVSANKEDISDNPKMEVDSSMSYKVFLDYYFGLIYGNLIKQD